MAPFRPAVAAALRDRVLLAVVTATITLTGPATAVGHTSLAGTTPPSGARLSVAPTRVVVAYSGPLGAVSDAEARVGARSLAGTPRLDPGDRRRLVIPLTGTATGVYRVSWSVVASDGHPMGGELSFTVRTAASLRGIHRVGAEARRAAARVTAGVRGQIGA